MFAAGERFNGLSHLAGFALAIAGLVALVAQLGPAARPWHAVGSLTFALAVLFLYAASIACHASRGRAKRLWERLDHVAIFVLIAGTATPFALSLPSDPWAWGGLVLVWAAAGLGIGRELWHRPAPQRPSVLPYVAVGWLAVAVAVRACRQLPGSVAVLLVAGGCVYTLGTFFYVRSAQLRHAHGIWHLFVLAGTGTHYAAVYGLAGGG
ncbi:hemolysin III family protein [Xenophilus arseniciresistens]|uniref:Hemolysin III family protein n=1 Tax=Xenophilus arseniciresistens TaxID=1283306 RepID=A0AAE3N5D0_9BURK|nr:hemolysin III family protein [Xenophilus arseniciresistens]MDA7415178.1 hemolysin III family protein [Xenophilus arseniciresistens]